MLDWRSLPVDAISMNYDDIKARVTALPPSLPVFPETLALARRVLVDDVTDAIAFLRFTREIHWVRCVEATVQLRQGPSLIRNDGSYLDTPFCGALPRAATAARATAQALNLQLGQPLQAVVWASVADVPMLPLTGSLVHFKERFESREQKLSLPASLWLYDTAQLDTMLKAQEGSMEERLAVDWPWVEARTVMAPQVVWTSGSEADLALDLDAWMARWAATLQSQVPDLSGVLRAG